MNNHFNPFVKKPQSTLSIASLAGARGQYPWIRYNKPSVRVESTNTIEVNFYDINTLNIFRFEK